MEDNGEPKLQTESSGGSGPGGKTRIGANTSGESGAPKRVHIDRCLTVKELAGIMGLSETAVIKQLFYGFGEARTVNQSVELDLAKQTVLALGFELI